MARQLPMNELVNMVVNNEMTKKIAEKNNLIYDKKIYKMLSTQSIKAIKLKLNELSRDRQRHC